MCVLTFIEFTGMPFTLRREAASLISNQAFAWTWQTIYLVGPAGKKIDFM